MNTLALFHALGHLEASIAEIENAVIAARRLSSEAAFVQKACSELGADEGDRLRIKQLRTRAAMLSVDVHRIAPELRKIAGTSLDLPGDIRESIEVLQGDAA